MPEFKTWSHENLVSFAEAANAKMKEQDDRIQQLQCDLKVPSSPEKNMEQRMNPIEMVTTIAKHLKNAGDEEVYGSFARMLALVAAAHTPNGEAKCVLIYDDGDNVITMGANVDAVETVDLCNQLRDSVMSDIMSNAPPKEMFN